MNKKRYALSVVAAFVAMHLYEFLLHGNLLMGMYKETAALWRPQEEMATYFPVMLVSQLAMVLVVTYLFTLKYEGRGIGEGVRFGAIIGIIWAIMMVTSYAYMPIPAALGVAWFAGGFIEGIVVGIVLALTYRR